MYRLEVTPAAERNAERLKKITSRQDFERLRYAIRALTQDPRPQGVQKMKDKTDRYRIRIGNYRVIYSVEDDDQVVVVSQISRRNEATYK